MINDTTKLLIYKNTKFLFHKLINFYKAKAKFNLFKNN